MAHLVLDIGEYEMNLHPNKLLCYYFFSENNENQQAATTQDQDKLLWAYVQPTPEVVQELSADSMPRVKLTGKIV